MNPGTSISYNGNSLQSTTVATNDIDHHGQPTKEAKPYVLSHADGTIVPFVSWSSKTVTIAGSLNATSIAAMDALIDTFKGYFTPTSATLSIGYNGTTRNYTAIPNAVTVTRPYGLNSATFKVEFLCLYPFGLDPGTTTALSASGRTLQTYTDASYTFLGTAPWQRPVTTITYTTATGSGNSLVIWGNSNTGQQISIFRTWANGDVLVIDDTLKTVTVNGFPVDFNGAFPEFAPGASSMFYSDSLTTRNFAITVVYTTSWM